MAKNTRSYPKYIKKMDWPEIVFLLFLVIFFAGLTCKHFVTKQQQLRWQKWQEIKNSEINSAVDLEINDDLLSRADLNQDQEINQADVQTMEEAFLAIDSESLKADLNQDGRVDAKDYAILTHIIESQESN
ncbi:MAG: hypothetical protein GX559_03160 [Candidatus Pacebacteria bacterium]|nr:hypothetical protein [Candidatus Paceibacterota bacterium]